MSRFLVSYRDDFTCEAVIIGVRIWRFRCNWGGREGVAKQQGEWKTQIHTPGQGGTRMEQKEGKTTLMIRAYGSTKYFHIARCDCCRFRFQDFEALVFPMKYSYAHVVLRCRIEVSWQKKKLSPASVVLRSRQTFLHVTFLFQHSARAKHPARWRFFFCKDLSSFLCVTLGRGSIRVNHSPNPNFNW